MAHCTRNKIAQAMAVELRVLPATPSKPHPFSPASGNRTACRRTSTKSTLKSLPKSRPMAESPTSNWQTGRHLAAALPAPGQDAGGGGLHPGLPRLAGSAPARLRCHRVCLRASVEPGRSRSARVRDVRPRRTLGAGMLDAVGRSRFHPEMRRARHGDVPGFRHAPDRSTACAQRQDVAGAAQFEIRGGGAARFEGRVSRCHCKPARQAQCRPTTGSTSNRSGERCCRT